MECFLGLLLVKTEPMDGGCGAHSVALPGDDVGLALEMFHALAKMG